MLQVREAVHHDFDRNGDLLFHFLRGPPGPLCDHLHIVVGDVGIRFDRQVFEGDHTPGEKQNRDGYDEQAIAQGESDNSADHFGGSIRLYRAGNAPATYLSAGTAYL